MKADHFRTGVVGLTFNPEYPECVYAIERRILNLSLATPGKRVRLRLVRNPDSEYDPNAIEVWVDRLPDITGFLGYLPRGVSARLAPELDEHGDDTWAAEVETIVVNDAHPDQPGVRLLAWRVKDGHP